MGDKKFSLDVIKTIYFDTFPSSQEKIHSPIFPNLISIQQTEAFQTKLAHEHLFELNKNPSQPIFEPSIF